MLVKFLVPVRLFCKKENGFKVYHPGRHEIDAKDVEEDKKNPAFSKFFEALYAEGKLEILGDFPKKARKKQVVEEKAVETKAVDIKVA